MRSLYSLRSRFGSPKNDTNLPVRSMNAAVFASSTRVAKMRYGRADEKLPTEYTCVSRSPDVDTHVTSVAPLAVKIKRSPGSAAPMSNSRRPAAMAAEFAAIVRSQSTESNGMAVQLSPSLTSGGCSESVRPTVHAASSHVVAAFLVDTAVTRSAASAGAHAAEIG